MCLNDDGTQVDSDCVPGDDTDGAGTRAVVGMTVPGDDGTSPPLPPGVDDGTAGAETAAADGYINALCCGEDKKNNAYCSSQPDSGYVKGCNAITGCVWFYLSGSQTNCP